MQPPTFNARVALAQTCECMSTSPQCRKARQRHRRRSEQPEAAGRGACGASCSSSRCLALSCLPEITPLYTPQATQHTCQAKPFSICSCILVFLNAFRQQHAKLCQASPPISYSKWTSSLWVGNFICRPRPQVEMQHQRGFLAALHLPRLYKQA